MKVEFSYDKPDAAASAKALVLVHGFAQLEGLSKTAICRKLDSAQIRGTWRREGEGGPPISRFAGPRSMLAFDQEVDSWVEVMFDEDLFESFAAEVIADNSGKFCGNQLRFGTKAEADAYALDLYSRWTLVRERRSVGSNDPINARWKDGHLERLET